MVESFTHTFKSSSSQFAEMVESNPTEAKDDVFVGFLQWARELQQNLTLPQLF